ncbi:hypothetical protein COT48_04330 [Candidatus Woesearchaeota archaeon CG08_land_8_20_14_0_20_47_9]|nr:MAG: hypothetical protein AUJ69_03330 [Candidatus Woesearchaeota archaeon CG1_02_47_18]PIO03570.1 MAG: hypothetical protein COT48_04330 [Candidatus Woesearchaeota archaeon CG08_land_8_20_14_0_20_47_9]HII29529.1 hypothetical protein [Candidatus Woesearchaeota archaeon]
MPKITSEAFETRMSLSRSVATAGGIFILAAIIAQVAAMVAAAIGVFLLIVAFIIYIFTRREYSEAYGGLGRAEPGKMPQIAVVASAEDERRLKKARGVSEL